MSLFGGKPQSLPRGLRQRIVSPQRPPKPERPTGTPPWLVGFERDRRRRLDELVKPGGIFGGSAQGANVDQAGFLAGTALLERTLILASPASSSVPIEVPPGTRFINCLVSGSNPAARAILDADGERIHVRPGTVIRVPAPFRKARIFQDDGSGYNVGTPGSNQLRYPLPVVGVLAFAFGTHPDARIEELPKSRKPAALLQRLSSLNSVFLSSVGNWYIDPLQNFPEQTAINLTQIWDFTDYSAVGVYFNYVLTGGTAPTLQVGLAGYAANQLATGISAQVAFVLTSAVGPNAGGRVLVGEAVDNVAATTETGGGSTFQRVAVNERFAGGVMAYVLAGGGGPAATTFELELWGFP